MLRLAGARSSAAAEGRTGTGQRWARRIWPRCALGVGKGYGSARLHVFSCICSQIERWKGEQGGEKARARHAERLGGSFVNN